MDNRILEKLKEIRSTPYDARELSDKIVFVLEELDETFGLVDRLMDYAVRYGDFPTDSNAKYMKLCLDKVIYQMETDRIGKNS